MSKIMKICDGNEATYAAASLPSQIFMILLI